MVEVEFMKLLKELISEEAIYAFNREEPMNPEILVKGIGRYTLKSAKQNVRRKLEELFKTIEKSDDPYVWRQASWMLKNEPLHNIMDTIISAHDELQTTRKKGGTKSKRIEKE